MGKTSAQESTPVDFAHWLAERNILVCLRTREFQVNYQNQESIQVCGERCGCICRGHCAKLCPKGADLGVTANADFGAKTYSLSILPIEDHVLTLGVPASQVSNTLLKLLGAKKLSPREIEIAVAMSQGRSNQEIAAKLSISRATLKTHINHIYRKLGTDRRCLSRRPAG